MVNLVQVGGEMGWADGMCLPRGAEETCMVKFDVAWGTGAPNQLLAPRGRRSPKCTGLLSGTPLWAQNRANPQKRYWEAYWGHRWRCSDQRQKRSSPTYKYKHCTCNHNKWASLKSYGPSISYFKAYLVECLSWRHIILICVIKPPFIGFNEHK
jgi:hypothetical protein